MRLEGHSVAVLQHWKGILAGAMVHRGKKLSSEGPLRRNQDFLQAVFFSSRGQIRVRSVTLLAILHPPSYHPLPQDMSVTLVAHTLISSRSRTFPLVIPNQQVGQSWADLDRADLLRKASEARVNRRLRRYYLIVLLLPNIFTLACLPLSSI